MLSHTTTPRAPAVLYAQDKNQIFLTIDLQDVQEHELVKSDSQVSFKTVKDNIPYEFNLELFSKVDEKSWNVTKTNRNIVLVVQKLDKTASFWPRLNKTGKLSFIKTDFSKWKDEDEDDEEEESTMQKSGGMSDQLMQMMGGGQLSPDMLQGMMGGGAGAASDSGDGMTNVNIEEMDSDDEELPPLEENTEQ